LANVLAVIVGAVWHTAVGDSGLAEVGICGSTAGDHVMRHEAGCCLRHCARDATQMGWYTSLIEDGAKQTLGGDERGWECKPGMDHVALLRELWEVVLQRTCSPHGEVVPQPVRYRLLSLELGWETSWWAEARWCTQRAAHSCSIPRMEVVEVLWRRPATPVH